MWLSLLDSLVWCDDCVGCGRSGEDEDRYEHDFVPVPSFIIVHMFCECVKTFCSAHSTSECDKQNSRNLELKLFHLKHKASIKQLSI